jgi:hypothetical protein
LGAGAGLATAKDIVHDAEFYVLKAQHGEQWSQEDQALEQKLAALKRPPSIRWQPRACCLPACRQRWVVRPVAPLL